MRARRLAPLVLMALVGAGVASPAANAATAPAAGAVNVFTVLQGSTAPVGDVTVTETSAGQLTTGDRVLFRFSDSASAATLHFGAAGTVGGSHGLTGTSKILSSSGSLLDEVEVTVVTPSTGAFPGVLTLSGLSPALDATAATGPDKVAVTDTVSGPLGTTSDANVVASSTTAKAGLTSQTNPTIVSTGSGQSISNVVVTEPTKGFFKTGDVLTFTLRDAQGSTDNVGLASTPSAGGGSMQVSVHGATTDTVQVNDTSFTVRVDAQDPSNGSTSAITITNLAVTTAQAPLGAVTLTAVLTTGAATQYLVPGRVTVAGVGGNTSTTSAGTPSLAVGATGQPAANVSTSAAAGSLVNGDTVSLTVQEPGVTFTAAAPPRATTTTGDLVLTSSTAVVDHGGTRATWTVKTGNARATSLALGPITYDVAASATPGDLVTLLASGSAGSAFNSQNVDDAVLAGAHPVGRFTTLAADLAPLSGAPWNGAPVHFGEAAAGSLPVGSSLTLVTPYATQIAAYRTTFAAVPSATVTGDLGLGAPVVNSSAVVVQTRGGPITAPAQTVVSFPVTKASTAASSVTVGGLVYALGSYVPPGALVGTGAVVPSSGPATDGEQYVDLQSGRGLGTTTAGAAPVVTFTSYPASSTTSTEATFAFTSDPTGADFSCTIDGVNFGRCTSPVTLTGLSSASHTFSVVPALNGSTGQPASYTWSVDNTPPTALAAGGSLAGLAVVFSEPVLGASGTTLTWTDASTGAVVAGTTTCRNGSTTTACNASTGVTSATLVTTSALLPGATYQVTVPSSGTITDLAGTPMASTTLTTRASLVAQETSAPAVVRWRSVPASAASGGSYAVAHRQGARTTFTFTGTAATWYAVRGPAMGTATVYVDGAAKKVVNLWASTPSYGAVAYAATGLTSAQHTLMVVVNGTKGTSTATDTNVSVDRFTSGATTVQQDGPGVVTTWRRVATTSASGGGYSLEDLAGASHATAFRGTGVTWYAVAGPGMGRASVYVDGALKATVDLFATATTYGRVGYGVTGLSATALHTVKVVVLGTHRTGASGSAVTVDRFVVR